MKQKKMNIAGPVFIVAVAWTACWVNAGDLNPPPGAIMPTDRVPLNQQAVTLPFTISAPGSYVLTSNLIGSSGLDGIIIDASDVTLDLNGFTLIGVTGSLDGIRVNATRSHISVTHGSIRGWGGNGINAGSCDNGRFEALSIGSSGIDGIVVGSNSIVRDLSVSGNGGAGIHVGGVRNRVDGCHATGNGTGVNVQNIENLVLRNSAAGNSVDFNIATGNAFGPIVNVGGIGDISTMLYADHPWANFALSCAPTMWCFDFDGDGFGDPNVSVIACTPPTDFVSDCTDCDDMNDMVYPGMTELCDALDNDCNAGTSDGSDEPWLGQACDGPDSDLCQEGVFSCDSASGTQVCEDATGDNIEVCDGFDNDCDSIIDEGVCLNGDPCTNAQMCQSGFCVDGVCCNNACSALCERCSGFGPSGTCTPIPNSLDPDNDCVGPDVCNGAGACCKMPGQSCVNGSECCSGGCLLFSCQ